MTDTKPDDASDIQDQYNNLPVGEILRRVRLQYNLSLPEVEESTRIRATYIEALELGDFERLPGQVYVTGFVKVYSEFLGLDPNRMVQLLKTQTGHKVTKPTKIFHVATEDQKVPSFRIIIASALVLIVVLLAWKLGKPGMQEDHVPDVPQELTQQLTAPQKPTEEETVAKASVQADAAKPKTHPVVLKATQDVWLEIRDGADQPVFSRVLKTGEEYWVPEEAVGYKMTTGNAGGLEVVVDGATLPPLAGVGEVKRNVSLNSYDLKGEPAPAPTATPVPEAGKVEAAPVQPDASITPAPSTTAIETVAAPVSEPAAQPVIEPAVTPAVTEPVVEAAPEAPKPKRKRLAEPMVIEQPSATQSPRPEPVRPPRGR